MELLNIKKLLTSLLITIGISNANQFCNTIGHTGESIVETTCKISKIGGIDYELWFNGGSNSATFYSDGSMSCSFCDTLNYICRTGLSFDSTKPYNQIGHLYADYKYIEKDTRNIEYSYIGVYGWTKDPLVEYLIVENWIGNPPGVENLGKNYGDFIIDGTEYSIYEFDRTGHSIVGEASYKRYFSVRKTPNSCGTIDITAHFEQWDNIGLTLGNLYEAKVFAQVGGNSSQTCGSVDFPYASVYIKD
ncbi:glycoside hydrolase family 11 protein, partial [Piromyces sp. E2]